MTITAKSFRKVMATTLSMAVAAVLTAGGLTAQAADTPLNYRLKWLLNVSTVGDVWADTHGLFRREGLAVTVKAGGPERNAIRELELGQADFGVASADQVIRSLSKGSPVVVIAQLFQINPLQWMHRTTMAAPRRLADLKGRTIGITYGGNDETIMRTLLARGGIAESEVTLFSVRYDYTPFYRGRVDLWPVYRNAQGPIIARHLKKAGEAVAFFDPTDFGVRFVANSVITSRKMLQRDPETARRFTRALLTGWREALAEANEPQVQAMLQKIDPDTPPEVLKEQLILTRQMVLPSKQTVLGSLDVDAWRQTETILLEQKQIPAPVAVQRALVTDLIPQ